jgi:beta-1,2-mannobiose phosphorylase / 1,2-beta-oligomannan phosphorylase
VRNVVFPSGAVVIGEDLYIYYGAADQRVAVASVKLQALLDRLKKSTAR